MNKIQGYGLIKLVHFYIDMLCISVQTAEEEVQDVDNNNRTKWR